MTKTIGEYFRFARVSAQLPIEDVCANTGLIEVDQLVALENGTYRPPLDTLFALVNTYNLNPDEFIELLYSLASERDARTASETAPTAKKKS
jgi:transcriptional regulator with XRE-family HTH domain